MYRIDKPGSTIFFAERYAAVESRGTDKGQVVGCRAPTGDRGRG